LGPRWKREEHMSTCIRMMALLPQTQDAEIFRAERFGAKYEPPARSNKFGREQLVLPKQ
jgi:hypothetical protein